MDPVVTAKIQGTFARTQRNLRRLNYDNVRQSSIEVRSGSLGPFNPTTLHEEIFCSQVTGPRERCVRIAPSARG